MCVWVTGLDRWPKYCCYILGHHNNLFIFRFAAPWCVWPWASAKKLNLVYLHDWWAFLFICAGCFLLALAMSTSCMDLIPSCCVLFVRGLYTTYEVITPPKQVFIIGMTQIKREFRAGRWESTWYQSFFRNTWIIGPACYWLSSFARDLIIW